MSAFWLCGINGYLVCFSYARLSLALMHELSRRYLPGAYVGGTGQADVEERQWSL